MTIINTRGDLEALKGTPDYATALQLLLGSAQTWVNQAAAGQPVNWQLVPVLTTIESMGYVSLDDLLAECAAAGIQPPPAPPAPVPFVGLTLAQAQATAIQSMIDFADALTAQVTNRYPRGEVDSWPAQLAEARLVQAGQTPPAPSLLQAIVTAANSPAVTMASLAASIITNATNYQNIVAWIQTIRTGAQTQIGAATDPSQIPAIVDSLTVSASATAATFGLTV